MAKYKIVDISAERTTALGEWWYITVKLEHQRSWIAKLFGKKPFIRTYHSTTGDIWDCLETHERLYALYPNSMATKLRSIQKLAPQHYKMIQEERKQLAVWKAECERVKEEKALQARMNRSRFSNIE